MTMYAQNQTLAPTTQKRLTKSVLSMYLRTKCDRELYFSLSSPGELQRLGLPVPLQARPGIGVLKTAGVEFETERNKLLISAFGADAIFAPDANGNPSTAPLKTLLARGTGTPRVILQGKIEPHVFKNAALAALGLPTVDIALTPEIAGMIPDVILVRPAEASDNEVLLDGSSGPIDHYIEKRLALSVIDIKHTAEANPSYRAEVALYAIMLANWLRAEGLDSAYFVTTKAYLWTRYSQNDSSLVALMNDGNTHTPVEFAQALITDGEDIYFNFYGTAIIRFFRDILPRVIRTGNTNWRNLEWHVDARCAACDFLGIEAWANAPDKAKIQANPDHYCLPNAESLQHLSRVAGISRGARKTLELCMINDTTALASTTGAEPVFREHTYLKRDKSRLHLRADALHNKVTTADGVATLGTLARYPHISIYASVDFDASAGMLTGLALKGTVTGYQAGVSPRTFPPTGFVVENKTLATEWAALEGFLTHIADWIDQANQYLQRLGGQPPLNGQIIFWDKRQFEELCKSMGRHLPNVMALADRQTRALAWLFPPEELLEAVSGAISPNIVFIEDIIRQYVFAPTPHVITLFDIATEYFDTPTGRPPFIPNSFYREYMTNGIPRERIYEIWSQSPTVQRGRVSYPRTTVISEYNDAMKHQANALHAVTNRIRKDFGPRLLGVCPAFDLRIPSGARGIAFDSKLWLWWEKLEYNTSRIEAHDRLARDADSLESSFEAIRLIRRIGASAAGNPIYSVSPDSTEVKLDDGQGFLTIGLCSEPGFPLQKIRSKIPANAAPFPGDPATLNMPFFSQVTAKLIRFDRANLKAEVEIETRDPYLLRYLAVEANLDFSQDIFLTESKSAYKWYEICQNILRVVGNPPIAIPDPNAAHAMQQQPSARLGQDAVLPISRVLWQPDILAAQTYLAAADAQAIANDAQSIENLNPSQSSAVVRALQNKLTLIWGPPGTGKTKTLSALAKALAADRANRGQGIKILVSAYTYKATQELIGRIVSLIEKDASCPCDVFLANSRTRTELNLATSAPHIQLTVFNMEQNSTGWQDCSNSLSDPTRITIVATGVFQAYKFAEWGGGQYVSPIFDYVILDECSQMPVTKAISALATLKDDAGLVIAGDHKQMPPIHQLEPPVGAEYLVGSIQDYLLQRFPGRIHPAELLENYRSSETLVKYARTLDYPQKLIAHFPATKIHLRQALPTPTAGYPASLPYSSAWNDALDPDRAVVTLLHDDDLSSQSNAFEARMVAGLVYSLWTSVSKELDGRGPVTHCPPSPDEFWKNCVGIVTPHRAQKAMVAKELKALFPTNPPALIDGAVDTVEKFQGGERQVILVSFGIGDSDLIAGEETFLMQMERTNVAISRAMAKCIVIMPSSLAGHIPEDKRALQSAYALKGYVDQFCNMSADIQIQDGQIIRQGKIRWAA